MIDFISYAEELHELMLKSEGAILGESVSINEAMQRWVEETRKLAEADRIAFFAGNGASATMAEHLGFDAMQNGNLKTVNFAETSYITAVSNDLCYEDVFLLKLERMANPGDMLITISSSGNSPNIVKALNYAKENGLFTVTLSAMRPDNKSRQIGDVSIYVPAQTYGLAESLHSAMLHGWLDLYMEKYLGGRH